MKKKQNPCNLCIEIAAERKLHKHIFDNTSNWIVSCLLSICFLSIFWFASNMISTNDTPIIIAVSTVSVLLLGGTLTKIIHGALGGEEE